MSETSTSRAPDSATLNAIAEPTPTEPTISVRRPSTCWPEALGNGHKADAVEDIPNRAPVLRYHDDIRRADLAGARRCLVQERQDLRFVRDRDDQSHKVPEPADTVPEGAQRCRRNPHRHAHGVDTVVLEQRVPDGGRANLRNRIADYRQDTRQAVKLRIKNQSPRFRGSSVGINDRLAASQSSNMS